MVQFFFKRPVVLPVGHLIIICMLNTEVHVFSLCDMSHVPYFKFVCPTGRIFYPVSCW